MPSKQHKIPLSIPDQIDAATDGLIREMAQAAVDAEIDNRTGDLKNCIAKANTIFSKWQRGYFCALRSIYARRL